jgi:ABC-2 type transport system permease protein
MAMGVNTVMGVVLVIGAERQFGTLSTLFVTPANRFRVLFGRTIFHMIDGLFGVVIGLTYATLLFGVSFQNANLGALLFIVVFTSVVSVGYGLILGGYGLFSRDVGMIMNAGFFILFLFSGVNFPVEALPVWLKPFSYAIPLTYGVMAARKTLEGIGLESVSMLLLWEAVTGVAMILVGYALFNWFEKLSKKKGTLDVV